jgi:hypothetical protein
MPDQAHRVSEADWLRTVGDTLDLYGWAWIHHRPARRAHGKWETATQGNSARGWPDIFAVRGLRAIALELKTTTGRITTGQTGWLERLRLVGVDAYLIRLPQDWDHFTTITAPDPEQLTLTTATTSNERKEPR